MGMLASRMASPIDTALVVAGAAPGAATSALALAIATAIIGEIVPNAIVPGPPMLAPAAGGPIPAADSTITGLDAARLAIPIKAGLIAAGAANIAATDALATDVATAVCDELGLATVPPAGLTATNTLVTPGTVTGTAAVASLNPARLSVPLKDALVTSGAADGAPTLALALAMATSITTEILGFAVVSPVAGIVASAGGGPLIGTLSIA